MHCIRGIGIGKKFLKLFGKNIKTKVLPLPYTENENTTIIPFIHANLSNYIKSKGFFHLDTLPKIKRGIRKLNKNIENILSNSIHLSTNSFYSMYFIQSQIKKKASHNPNNSQKKISLGCQLKNIENMNGMKIVLVKEDSLAEKEDLRVNDIISEINKIEIHSITDFKSAIENGQKENQINMKIIRKDETNREIILEKILHCY